MQGYSFCSSSSSTYLDSAGSSAISSSSSSSVEEELPRTTKSLFYNQVANLSLELLEVNRAFSKMGLSLRREVMIMRCEVGDNHSKK